MTRRVVIAILCGITTPFTPWLGAEDPGAVRYSLATKPGDLPAAPAASTVAIPRPGHPPPSITGFVDVSAINAAFVAVDREGRMVDDLRLDELTVFEDGRAVRALALARRQPGKGGEAAQQGLGSSSPREPAERRVVVYLSGELGDRGLFRNLGRQMEAETDCLAGLGPVDVVVANPEPTEMLTAELRSTEVRSALRRAIVRAEGGASVSRMRRNFARDFDRRTGFDSGFGPGSPSPGSVVVTTRDAINRELELVRDSLRRLVVWMQTQPPERGGVLIWMTGGFALNPAEFYISRVEQIDPVVARSLRADSGRFRIDEDLRWLIETALSLGWTVIPVTCNGGSFLFNAEISGGAGMITMAEQDAISLSGRGGGFVQRDSNHSLRIVAHATGGHLAANRQGLQHAFEHLKSAYVISFQVERPLDGQIHRLEIRTSRPGVKICCRRHGTASGTLRGVAMGRALRLLAGEAVVGGRALTARLVNISRQGRGKRVGDLELTADLGELRAALGPLGLGEMRVTVVVELASGAPFVFHEELPLDWRRVDDVWRYSARFSWPNQARRVAVVAEELVSASWGATAIPLR